MSRPYSLIFLLSAMLFAGSTLVPPPTRFYLWGLTLVLGFLITLRMLPRLAPVLDSETGEFSYISHSAVERFGLFTIIVLGEVIVGVVGGVASQETFLVSVGLTAALGMLIAIGFWWVYFDFVSHRLPSRTQTTVMGWLGLHLPMTLCIAAAGAAVLHIVEHSGDPLTAEVRWLLVVAVALVLVSIAALMQTIQIPDNFRPLYRRGGILTFLAGVIIASLGFTNLDTIPLLALLIVLMLTPIFYGLKVWIVELGAEEIVV